MRTSVQAVLGIILVLVVITGIYMAGSSVFDSAGGNIEDSGNESGIRMDCIFQNQESSDEACRKDSSFEVMERDVQKT